MAFVQGNDFEEPIEEDRTAHMTEDRHPHAVHRRIEGGVPLESLAVDPDLKQPEFGREAAERGDVPVSERFDGERGCGIARTAGLSWHDGSKDFRSYLYPHT